MIHIYYGMGKGKTSTLNGSAIRAKGAGLKVLIIRFLKGSSTAEDSQLEKLGIKILRAQSSSKFVVQMGLFEKTKTKNEINQMLKFIQFNNKNYDLIILDEYLDLAADNVNMLTSEELLNNVEELTSEIMISGHTHIPSLFAKADLITKYVSEKHYFNEGINARKGIEF